MEKINLAAPWYTYVYELKALFGEDPEINVVFNSDTMEVKIFVENQKKADALMQLLPVEREFGSVTLKVTVVPADTLGDSTAELMCAAFEGNPVLKDIRQVSSVIGTFNYAVFRKEVVQFYNDQLDDPHGNKSTLHQEIARDVFGDQDGIFYCTDVTE